MPPFRAGLLKRKIDSTQVKNAVSKTSEDEEDAEPELLRGEVNMDGDQTDSEQEENTDAASDGEQDTILFDDDYVDSTLGEEESASDMESDVSTELMDSEESDSEHSGDGSVDSGAESGPAHSAPHSEAGSSDEAQRPRTSVDVLADQIKETSVASEPVNERDEYSSGDTSDEEERRGTAGAVPLHWYSEYPHVGYDTHARRILKPPQRDAIDNFLRQCEDPEFWRTVRDPHTGQDVRLSAADLDLIARIRQGHTPLAEHDDYQPWVEWFTRSVLATPVRGFPDHKRSFLPSRSERLQIARIVHALNMGWTKTRKQIASERRAKRERKFYNLWGSSATAEEQERLRGVHRHIPAPRRALPSHAESYNPPPEYLLDDKEMEEWEALSDTPWKRKHTFLPTRHGSLRAVPAYPRYCRERFLRCLDLYLAPRALKMRLTIAPSELVPQLPSPRALQPFPTSEALCLRGHAAAVRSVDFDPTGQYIVSGGDDATVKVWETSTGRCLRTFALEEAVTCVAWGPMRGLSLVVAAAGPRLVFLNPGHEVGARAAAVATDELLRDVTPDAAPGAGGAGDERTSSAAQWQAVSPEQWERGVRKLITHFKPIVHVSWHARGDYVCVTLRDGASRSVLVHQLSRARTSLPFRRALGHVQCAVFHPTRPLLFHASQRVVRVYDLVKQELVKKLRPGAQWISALAVHPAGDNLLVASYDRKCMWFDLELSSQPYQTLRLHGRAVRSVAFHPRYPLFATAGDDPYLVVSHGMVYNDLLQNPLLVPLKQLAGPARRGELCVLATRFHPAQPWLLAAGADHTLRLYA